MVLRNLSRPTRLCAGGMKLGTDRQYAAYSDLNPLCFLRLPQEGFYRFPNVIWQTVPVADPVNYRKREILWEVPDLVTTLRHTRGTQ